MYKKISHTIVEEHFNHPSVLGEVNKRSKDFQIYTFPLLKQIEKDSINGWAQLSWRIRSLVISITSGDKDIDLLEIRMASDIDNIAKILRSTYGDTGVITFTRLLNNLMLSLVGVITDVNANTDTTVSMATLNDDTKAFADFLESVNSQWPASAVIDIFTQMENLYMLQTTSRMNKEWAAGVDAADTAYNIIVIEQSNGDPSFADIFSSGIIGSNEILIPTPYSNSKE
jgi:hypothetical protein